MGTGGRGEGSAGSGRIWRECHVHVPRPQQGWTMAVRSVVGARRAYARGILRNTGGSGPSMGLQEDRRAREVEGRGRQGRRRNNVTHGRTPSRRGGIHQDSTRETPIGDFITAAWRPAGSAQLVHQEKQGCATRIYAKLQALHGIEDADPPPPARTFRRAERGS